ncbi:MAG: hypothetical protein AB7P04_15980 [Bacteriovoracia bacterium]
MIFLGLALLSSLLGTDPSALAGEKIEFVLAYDSLSLDSFPTAALATELCKSSGYAEADCVVTDRRIQNGYDFSVPKSVSGYPPEWIDTTVIVQPYE